MGVLDAVRDLADAWAMAAGDIAAKFLKHPGTGGAPAGGDANAPAVPEVFICHSAAAEDGETAEMLRSFLEQEGVRCVTGPCDSPAVVRAVRALVLVFSNHADASAAVRGEVALAAAANMPVILFLTEDAAPGECLEGLLRGAFRIRAAYDHPVFSVPEVVRQVAKALGRELPGARERDWRGKGPGTYAHLRITTNPPGGHIRVVWPPGVAGGPSPFYLTATMSRVELEATMEGYEPKTCGHDMDDDSSAMDWLIGLRTVEAARAAREKEAAAKLNGGGNPGGGVSAELAERRRQWGLLDAAWRRALERASCDVYIGARPGQPCGVGPVTVVPRSDGCWVMNADRFDPLMRLYEDRVLSGRPSGLLAGIAAALRNRRACDPCFLPGFLADAVGTLRAGLLGGGAGPVAPCFDEFDAAAEAARGKWYVFDGAAYLAFVGEVRPLLPRGRMSGSPWAPGANRRKDTVPAAESRPETE